MKSDERPASALAALMDRTGEGMSATTRLALDQHGTP
jgi:hypothetical protein